MSGSARRTRLAARFYRLLLFAYPAEFRREHGPEAVRVFVQLDADARSMRASAALWLRAIRHVIVDGIRERMEQGPMGVDSPDSRDAAPGAPHRRTSRILSDLRQDAVFALRQIRRQPGFSAVAIIVMALGIGASTAVIAVVDGALWRPLPFPGSDQLVYVTDRQGAEKGVPASWPEFQDWHREGRFFTALAAFASNGYTLRNDSGPEIVFGGLVAGDFTGVLGLPPVLGRAFLPAAAHEHTREVMLGEDFWRTRFGADHGVLGRTLDLESRETGSYTIVGVMPREAELLVQRRDLAVWLPLELPEPFRARRFHLLRVMGRLSPELTHDAARVQSEALASGLQASGVTTHGLDLMPVRDTLIGNSRPMLAALAGAVVVLLLIVSANLSNLFLTRLASRAKEFAVRTAIGAGRFRLVRQIVTESAILACAGGALGFVLALWSVDVVGSASNQAAALVPSIGADVRVVLFTVAISLAIVLLVGLVPAVRSGRAGIVASLREGQARAGGPPGSRSHRRALVGLELALSVVLLAGAGLMVKSLVLLLKEDPGFRIDHTLTFSIGLRPSHREDAAQVQFFNALLDKLRALPGVLSASAVSHLPLGGSDTAGGFTIPGQSLPGDQSPHSKKRIAAPGYFEAMGIPLVAGRTFDERDRQGAREVVVISESIARKYWPGQSPIGREIDFSWGPGDPQQIIGVVGDVRHDGLDQAIVGAIYRPLAQFPRPAMTVVVRTSGDPLALARAAREEVRALDPWQPIHGVETMRDVVRQSVNTRETMMRLLVLFALVALVLAAVGVYAVTAQSVAQRTREIGVRMALGARSGDVLRLVLREEGTVIVAALTAGLMGAWALTRALAASLYEVSATDPTVFTIVASALGVIALMAAWLPAQRAAGLEPLAALRAE